MKPDGFAPALLLALACCTGFNLRERRPGQDTFVEFGAIAVDDRTETSFVVRASPRPGATPASALLAIHPDTGVVSVVTDLTGRTDARLVFPASGVLVMSEKGESERLELFDAATLQRLKTVETTVRYHGTRLSPSRAWVAVADNTHHHAPIHILDGASLENHVIPSDGEWLEAMWGNRTDTLYAIVFYGKDRHDSHARILSWSVPDLADAAFQANSSGLWPAKSLDINIIGVMPDLAWSFTWIGVSPDDRYAAFPVRRPGSGGSTPSHELLLVDTQSRNIRFVYDAKGPVTFTPDGATLVSYRDTGPGDQQSLLLVDTKTLEQRVVRVPIKRRITYVVTQDGSTMVVASNLGGQRLALVDLTTLAVTSLPFPGLALNEWVRRGDRGELWLVDHDALFRVDLANPSVERVEAGFDPKHINILPKRDRLVLDDSGAGTLLLFDPETRRAMMRIDLSGSATAAR